MENFLNAISIFMIIGIIVVYGLSSFWNIMFLIKSKWQVYSGIKLYTALCSIIFVLLYSYLLFDIITGEPKPFSVVNIAIMRPAVFLLGGAIASAARARYTSLVHGGERWILRN